MAADAVRGLRETVRALTRAGVDAKDISSVMFAIGQMVATDAQAEAPSVTDALAGSVRAGRSKNKAVVRAGGARVPYAGPIHFGWPARHIRPQPFLVEAVDRDQAKALQMLDAGLGNILKRNQLT